VKRQPHSTCRQTLISGMRDMGVEVVASTLPPLVVGPYTTDPYVCPHGTTFWLEPTGEQIAAWVKDGVA
jgi:hypothetical protein